MKSNEYFKIGWVKDAHGLRGEIYVKLLSQNPEWLSEVSQFQMKHKISGELLNFAAKKVKPHKQGIILRPEPFINRNHSEEWKGADVLIPREFLTTRDGEEPYLVELKGFAVEDEVLGDVGEVVGFMETGAHMILEVKTKNGVRMVPLVDAYIVELNREKKLIKMDLPKGLINED